MSNEPQSPSLRLKPRLSTGQPVATSEVSLVAPAAPAAPVSTGLAAVAPLPTPAAPAPLPAVNPRPLPPEPVPAPISSTPAPAPNADDPGKFKLKPRAALGGAAAPVSTPAAPVTPPVPAAPAAVVPAGVIPVLRLAAQAPAVPAPVPGPGAIVKPMLPAAALASPAFAKPSGPNSGRPNMPISPLPASGPVAMPTGGAGPRPQGKMVAQADEKAVARGKFAVKLLAALLVVAFGLFSVFAYNLWFADTPAPVVTRPMPAPAPAEEQPAVATETSPAPGVAETTAAVAVGTPQPAGPVVVDNPQSVPGQLIAQAQNAVAAHDAALGQPVDDVLTAASSPTAPTATTSPAAVIPAEVKPAPAPEPVAAPRPEPGANFKAFVVNLKISGVFQGENARAMLNGKMYRLGEVVDGKLGIVFLRIEPEDKRIVFEDAKRAIMSRRY